MANLAIIGDSFAAPYQDFDGAWYQQLAQSHSVINLAQAGVGQYKIRQQANHIPTHCDTVIAVTTSAFRVHANHNPFYPDRLHRHHNSDIIFSDAESRLPDVNAEHLVYYFKEIWDLDHAFYVHNLILQDLYTHCRRHGKKILPVTFFEPRKEEWDFEGQSLNLYHVAKACPGPYNHLSQLGHDRVFASIKERLQ